MFVYILDDVSSTCRLWVIVFYISNMFEISLFEITAGLSHV
jgi:hypothetical protein